MPDGIDRGTMAANYGFALAFMNSNPELKKLFNQAVRGTWTPDKFIARLRNTKWFKTHSANVRNAIMQETSDPATYKANVNQMYATVRDSWGSMFGTQGMDNKQMRAWAETAHRMGWSEAQLMDRMTRGLDYRKLLTANALGGKAAEVKGQMDSLLANYGIDLGDRWKARQLEKVMEGDDTVAGIQGRVRDMAMREYKAFADRIAAGETVSEIADPYVQKMAGLLELNPNDVGLQDAMIQRAMKQTTDKGKPAAMDLHTFSDFVRKDKRWQYTDNAKKQVSDVTENLLRSFGLLA
jgi:hypothetical protein